jgi:hypothetical protein
MNKLHFCCYVKMLVNRNSVIDSLDNLPLKIFVERNKNIWPRIGTGTSFLPRFFGQHVYVNWPKTQPWKWGSSKLYSVQMTINSWTNGDVHWKIRLYALDAWIIKLVRLVKSSLDLLYRGVYHLWLVSVRVGGLTFADRCLSNCPVSRIPIKSVISLKRGQHTRYSE